MTWGNSNEYIAVGTYTKEINLQTAVIFMVIYFYDNITNTIMTFASRSICPFPF